MRPAAPRMISVSIFSPSPSPLDRRNKLLRIAFLLPISNQWIWKARREHVRTELRGFGDATRRLIGRRLSHCRIISFLHSSGERQGLRADNGHATKDVMCNVRSNWQIFAAAIEQTSSNRDKENVEENAYLESFGDRRIVSEKGWKLEQIVVYVLWKRKNCNAVGKRSFVLLSAVNVYVS